MTFETRLLSKISDDIARTKTTPIDVDTELLLSGLIDSIGLLRLVDWIQADQDISIDPADMELEAFQTARRIMTFIERLRA